jgi:hypothetical protein
MPRSSLALLVLSLLCATSTAQEPVGAVVAWHADLAGTPALGPGWARLDGVIHQEPSSPFHGLFLPDLNGTSDPTKRRFLRGGASTAVFQLHALQGHQHAVQNNATDGEVSGICPAFMEPGASAIFHGPANVAVGALVDDGVSGTPRVDPDETRPRNMSVVWILKTSAGELPVGSIVAWHRDHPALRGRGLPAGWAPCDGSLLEDGLSPLNGQRLPELLASRRFLRGGTVSGTIEADALQDHRHRVTHDVRSLTTTATQIYAYAGGGTVSPTRPADASARQPIPGQNGVPRVARETRPTNMSVVWILKTRPGAALPIGTILGWHDEPAAALPPLGPVRSPSWHPCDGRTVVAPGNPFNGAVVPDLNTTGRFLRGGPESGVLQADAFQGHGHEITLDAFSYVFQSAPGSSRIAGCGDDFRIGTVSVGGVMGARVDVETRPTNMALPWILYLPGGEWVRDRRGVRAAFLGAGPAR